MFQCGTNRKGPFSPQNSTKFALYCQILTLFQIPKSPKILATLNKSLYANILTIILFSIKLKKKKKNVNIKLSHNESWALEGLGSLYKYIKYSKVPFSTQFIKQMLSGKYFVGVGVSNSPLSEVPLYTTYIVQFNSLLKRTSENEQFYSILPRIL